MNKVDICIFYETVDEKMVLSLKKHLVALKSAYDIVITTNNEIPLGINKKQGLDEILFSSDIILLAISPDFIASDLVSLDMLKLLKNKEIHPILFRECNWQITGYKEYNILPENLYSVNSKHWGNNDEGFSVITHSILKTIDRVILKRKLEKLEDQKLGVEEKLNFFKSNLKISKYVVNSTLNRLQSSLNFDENRQLQKELAFFRFFLKSLYKFLETEFWTLSEELELINEYFDSNLNKTTEQGVNYSLNLDGLDDRYKTGGILPLVLFNFVDYFLTYSQKIEGNCSVYFSIYSSAVNDIIFKIEILGNWKLQEKDRNLANRIYELLMDDRRGLYYYNKFGMIDNFNMKFSQKRSSNMMIQNRYVEISFPVIEL